MSWVFISQCFEWNKDYLIADANKNVTGGVVKRLLINKDHDQFISLALQILRMLIRGMFVVYKIRNTLTSFRGQLRRLATEFMEAVFRLVVRVCLFFGGCGV